MHITRKASYLLAFFIIFAFLASGILLVSKPTNTGSKNLLTADSEINNDETKSSNDQSQYKNSNKENQQTDDIKSSDQELVEEANDGFELKNFHRSETKNGQLLWEVVGSNATYHPSDNSVEVEKCLFSTRSKEGRMLTLEAGKAKLYLKGPSLTSAKFTADVTLNYGGELKIVTPQASYDKETGAVVTDEKVVVYGDWYKIEGVGLTANLSTEEYKVLNNVNTVLDPSKRNNDGAELER